MALSANEVAAEQRRLAGAASVVNVVADYVDDLVQLRPEELPPWLEQLGLPAGWRVAKLEGADVAPARVAVCGQQPDGRWDGCETISAFGFTGNPPGKALRDNADCTLRDLDASEITISTPVAALIAGVTAVRCSGFFTAAGQRIWAQYSTFVAGSTVPGKGRLIQHCLFVDVSSRAKLTEDIAQLSNDLQRAFLNGLDAA
jgi:hypothetical protein